MNHIFMSPFKFNLIDSNFSIWSYRDIKDGDPLVVLRTLDLRKDQSHTKVYDDGLGAEIVISQERLAAEAASVVLPHEQSLVRDKHYRQAKKEIDITGKIKGFEIMNLRTFEKLWISSFDFEHFR